MFAFEVFRECGHAGAPGDVELPMDYVEAVFRQRFLRTQALLCIAAGQDHLQSLARELPGNLEPNALVGAGHQRNPDFCVRHVSDPVWTPFTQINSMPSSSAAHLARMIDTS